MGGEEGRRGHPNGNPTETKGRLRGTLGKVMGAGTPKEQQCLCNVRAPNSYRKGWETFLSF